MKVRPPQSRCEPGVFGRPGHLLRGLLMAEDTATPSTLTRNGQTERMPSCVKKM